MKKIFSLIICFVAGCSTVDGISGFKNWKHPETGRENFSRDKSECEVIAQNATPEMYSKEMIGTRTNRDENAGYELGRLFSVWDYTKKCLIDKGYKKDE